MKFLFSFWSKMTKFVYNHLAHTGMNSYTSCLLTTMGTISCGFQKKERGSESVFTDFVEDIRAKFQTSTRLLQVGIHFHSELSRKTTLCTEKAIF